MSTTPDDNILFHNVTEEELALAATMDSPMTNDEFDAFMLSLSTPNEAEFSISDNSFQDLPPDLYSLLSQPVQDSGFEFTQDTPTDLGIDQAFLESASAMPPVTTPKEFVIQCGLNPSEFQSLEHGDGDVWDSVMHEILDKLTEWAKSTNLKIMNMAVSTQDIQRFGFLDDIPLPITTA
ncbi:hypothetical protein H0H92_002049 [Tricholoma furcatifolium]|nr:hypothetical protein H0H92_002049 [Tricholoma furcatifolium]